MRIRAIKTRIFKEKDDIVDFIMRYLPTLPDNSIVAITSKIVALSEERTSDYKSKQWKEKLIRDESDFAVKTKFVWMTIKDGHILASAGIDESNGNGKLVLLPQDSFKAAEGIRKALKRKYKVGNLGILITDSKLSPLRKGVVGAAVGYAGFGGLRDYRGTKDIFGRALEFSSTNIADSLATGAVLCMGEGNERRPLALITGAPVVFREKINRKELAVDPKEDMFYPLFRNFNGKKKN